MMENDIQTANHEKSSAALSSVVAAVGLTGFKIVVGLATGSLGILAEAAHSALDLVAALVTFLAVRLSGKPADAEHNYGHGKIENLSALFETLLLLATCGWIIYEAIQRLFFKPVEVEVSIWAFIVMMTSIVIDFSRSRILYRAARKYNSQALEADALHFSTDIWSSSVVILGLVFLMIAKRFPGLVFLKDADSIAALVVAMIVIYVSYQLGMRTIRGLLDTAPAGMTSRINTAVQELPGVIDVHHLRIRTSGPHQFIDAHILVDGGLALHDAHAITEAVEARIREISPEADVTVHPEPHVIPPEDPQEIARVQAAVASLPGVTDCHNIHLHYADSRPNVTAHVLVEGSMSLAAVHDLTEEIEKVVLRIIPGAEINIHPEPAGKG
jgi:cation diffusion facilitator family transporter